MGVEMSKRNLVTILMVFASLALTTVSGKAQNSTTAALTGFAYDASGAVVPGARVSVTSIETGLVRTAETSADGSYSFTLLPIGRYTLSLTKTGFESYQQSGIVLQVGQTAQVNATLQLGATTQTVQITAQVPLLDTQTSSVSQTVGEQRLSELPLNGRNPIELVSLVAGANDVSAPTILVGMRGGATASVNGSRLNENNYLFDGNNYSGVYFNTGLNYPNPDAMEEFNLITHNYSAEYGRNAGSIMAAVTKSGTNQFHGDVWEYLQNDDLDARNFFSPTVPSNKYNQFGFTAGAPIVRNKLFVFGTYQGFRIDQQGLLANAPVATAAERAGNFSADPTITDPSTGLPFPGNMLPPGDLNSVATKWYNQYVPLPNNPNGTITYLAPAPENTNQELAKIDYHISASHLLTGRWFHDLSTVTAPFEMSIPNYSTFITYTHQSDVSLSETWTISPTLINQAHFGITHVLAGNPSAVVGGADQALPSYLGMDMPDMRPYGPVFSITGNVGGWIDAEYETGLTQQYEDTLTWAHGKHTFKFGMQLYVDDYHNRSYAFTQGAYTFDGSFTGNAMADFLLGDAAQIRYAGQYIVDSQSKKFYPFVQDDWKVTPHLTLNLGFRWEFNGPYIDNSGSPADQQATFFRNDALNGVTSKVFPNAPPGLLYPGDPGVAPGLYPLPKTDLEPRLGLAWSPGGGKWVIRGGVGLFSDIPIPDLIGQTHANSPYTVTTIQNHVIDGLSDPFANYPGGNPWPQAKVFNSQNPTFVDPVAFEDTVPNYRDPRITEWNFSIQRELGANMLLNVSGVGSVARHLNESVQGNPALYIPGVDAMGNPLSTAANVDSRRVLDPGVLGFDQSARPIGNASYNSLQVTLERRFNRGLEFLSAYTYAHDIDTHSAYGIGGVNCQNTLDCAAEKGDADLDRRNIYNLSLIYHIPKMKIDNWAANHAANGWGLTGIFHAETGSPFTVVTGTNNSLDGDNNDRPNLVGNPLAVDRSSKADALAHWFNTAAYVPNPIGTYGDVGRNTLFGPSDWNLNFSILRSFPVSERWGRFDFRAEFYNTFNHANLINPVSNLASAQFGEITGTTGPRVIQFALKYLW
jgi:hypothetical protein